MTRVRWFTGAMAPTATSDDRPGDLHLSANNTEVYQRRDDEWTLLGRITVPSTENLKVPEIYYKDMASLPVNERRVYLDKKNPTVVIDSITLPPAQWVVNFSTNVRLNTEPLPGFPDARNVTVRLFLEEVGDPPTMLKESHLHLGGADNMACVFPIGLQTVVWYLRGGGTLQVRAVREIAGRATFEDHVWTAWRIGRMVNVNAGGS